MYHHINDHADLIVDTITGQSVEDYVALRNTLYQIDVSNNVDYQNQYRNYWRMNTAGLTDAHYDAYFQILEQASNGVEVSLEDICRPLYEIPSRQGRNTVQFSFATKLIHMVRPHMPIYDSMIRAFYFLPESGNSYESKLASRLSSYNFLRDEYARVIDERLLNTAIGAFRHTFGELATDEKVIDFLVWAFVRRAKRGAFRDRIFHHI